MEYSPHHGAPKRRVETAPGRNVVVPLWVVVRRLIAVEQLGQAREGVVRVRVRVVKVVVGWAARAQTDARLGDLEKGYGVDLPGRGGGAAGLSWLAVWGERRGEVVGEDEVGFCDGVAEAEIEGVGRVGGFGEREDAVGGAAVAEPDGRVLSVAVCAGEGVPGAAGAAGLAARVGVVGGKGIGIGIGIGAAEDGWLGREGRAGQGGGVEVRLGEAQVEQAQRRLVVLAGDEALGAVDEQRAARVVGLQVVAVDGVVGRRGAGVEEAVRAVLPGREDEVPAVLEADGLEGPDGGGGVFCWVELVPADGWLEDDAGGPDRGVPDGLRAAAESDGQTVGVEELDVADQGQGLRAAGRVVGEVVGAEAREGLVVVVVVVVVVVAARADPEQVELRAAAGDEGVGGRLPLGAADG
ncbi:hypothetical protein E4U21_005808 [Claviceps maximensis]|nr:hypothetical protein E4U21_005808 [Claviceps maximensis]